MKKASVKLFSFTILFTTILLSKHPITAQEILPFFHSLESQDAAPLPFVSRLNTHQENAATFSEEGIYLLPLSEDPKAMTNTLGAILFNNLKIEAKKSFEVAFDYSIFGGNGAEGFTFFLIDDQDNISNITAGAGGNNLGYTPNRANNPNEQYREKALTRGVLAIGFDVRGNFKNVVFSSDGKHRRHGFEPPKNGWAKATDGIDSYITVRSSYRDLLIGEDERKKDYIGFYTYLTKSTLATPTKNGSGTQNAYSQTYGYGMTENFNIRSNIFTTLPGAEGYRSAVFKFEMDPLNITKLRISLKIRYDDQNYVPIFEDYLLVSKSLINNAAAKGGDYNDDNIQISESIFFGQKNPAYYRIGFTAASGAYNDAIVIRNLVVRYLGTAEAYNISTEAMATIPVEIDPYKNSYGYYGSRIDKVQKTNDRHIFDNTAFRFVTSDGKEVKEYTAPEGIWKFDINTGIVTFIPTNGYEGIAKIHYKIKATNSYNGSYNIYSTDAYYSAPAEIIINVTSNYRATNPHTRTTINKSSSSKAKPMKSN